MGAKLLPCFYYCRHRNIVESCGCREKGQQLAGWAANTWGTLSKGWMLEIFSSCRAIRIMLPADRCNALKQRLQLAVLSENVGKLGSPEANWSPQSVCARTEMMRNPGLKGAPRVTTSSATAEPQCPSLSSSHSVQFWRPVQGLEVSFSPFQS